MRDGLHRLLRRALDCRELHDRGQGLVDQAPARLFAFRHPKAFARLIDRLVDSSVAYLVRQIEAGVEVVQIFDSWAGSLPPSEFDSFVVSPLRRIVAGVKAKRPETPVIAFVRGAGTHIAELAETLGADGYGLDTAVEPLWARQDVGPGTACRAISIRWPCSPAGRRSIARLRRCCGGLKIIRTSSTSAMASCSKRRSSMWSACLSSCAANERGLTMYLWIKALHVIMIISWMAGLLYLPRLFVYHAGVKAGPQAETFKTMERRLLAIIMRPAAAIAWITGLTLAVQGAHFHEGWLHAKLLLVLLLTGVHGYDEILVKSFREDRNTRSSEFFPASITRRRRCC